MYNDYDRHWRLLFFLDSIVYVRDTYDRIRFNDEERKTSKELGHKAVGYNITYFILMAIFAACAVLTYVFFSKPDISKAWPGIITVIVAIACLPYVIIYFILALNCDVKQMKLNKLSIGWVSLLFTLLISVAGILAVAITLLVMCL